jgi:kinesin family protein 2/24
MPNVPLARELEALAPLFFNQLTGPMGDVTGPKPVPVDTPATMFANVDTRIFVRARPVLAHETDPATTIRSLPGMRNCVFMSPEVTISGKTSIVPTSIPVDATFVDRDPNEKVYDACSALLPIAIEGGSTAVLCYGQTGSGKTYTTSGILRSIAAELERAMHAQLSATVTFIEVHADGCRDLISGEANVQILEDKTGQVQVLNTCASKVTCAADVLRLADAAVAARATKTTDRNLAGSSRSHMAARFVFRRLDTPWVTPGVMCVVDLAGSESAADAVGHDRERINETKFINSSLMTLKECIRARGQSAVTTKHVHIPFRQSKLTLLLRDSFELVVQRKTKTAMIACVSPLLRDARHTFNTLRYAALLYVSPKAGVVIQADSRDPATWSREEALDFIVTSSNNRVRNPEDILTAGDGRALAQLPEDEFVRRATTLCGLPSRSAEDLYAKVWKRVIDAKKIMRGNVQRAKIESAARRGEAAAIERLAGRASAESAPTEAGKRRRVVSAELADEKENEAYLADLTQRMQRGHRTDRLAALRRVHGGAE